MSESKLIDKKELIRRYPALGARRHRVDWLVRTRQIPFVRLSPRRIAFRPEEIDDWLNENSIPPQDL